MTDNNTLFEEYCDKQDKLYRILAYKEYIQNKELEKIRGYKLETKKKPLKYCEVVKIGKRR